jgi:hypothetical protein
MDRDFDVDGQAPWGFFPVGAGVDDTTDDVREWRWRNYTDHLTDLGYELHGASADAGAHADELDEAVNQYQRRSRSPG